MSSMRQGSTYQGLGPNPLAPSTILGGGGSLAFPLETYASPVLDLTRTWSGIELVPGRPGHFPITRIAQWLITAKAGTQTTPATTRAGNNDVKNNLMQLSSVPSNADVNVGIGTFLATGVGSPSNITRFMNLPMLLDVVTPASGTGGFSLFARAIIVAYWVSAGS